MISCGRDAAPYRGLGHTTIADLRPGEGPLGGLVSAFPSVGTDWILTHPGDAPFADASLVGRLTPAAEATGVAVPRAGDHRQNLILLMSRATARDLAWFYREGRPGREGLARCPGGRGRGHDRCRRLVLQRQHRRRPRGVRAAAVGPSLAAAPERAHSPAERVVTAHRASSMSSASGRPLMPMAPMTSSSTTMGTPPPQPT